MVDLNIGITNIVTNLGIPFEIILLIVVLAGGIIFFAKGFQFGALYLFIATGLLFMLFYHWDLNYTYPLVVCFMSLVIMALSFFGNFADRNSGGLV